MFEQLLIIVPFLPKPFSGLVHCPDGRKHYTWPFRNIQLTLHFWCTATDFDPLLRLLIYFRVEDPRIKYSNQLAESIGFFPKQLNYSWEVTVLARFWSAFNEWCTHLAHCFIIGHSSISRFILRRLEPSEVDRLESDCVTF